MSHYICRVWYQAPPHVRKFIEEWQPGSRQSSEATWGTVPAGAREQDLVADLPKHTSVLCKTGLKHYHVFAKMLLAFKLTEESLHSERFVTIYRRIRSSLSDSGTRVVPVGARLLISAASSSLQLAFNSYLGRTRLSETGSSGVAIVMFRSADLCMELLELRCESLSQAQT